MKKSYLSRWIRPCSAAAMLLATSGAVQAAGGYFILGYGPLAHQSAGTATATGLDAFSGATNPGKLSAVGDRHDLGLVVFSPYRRVQREGSGTDYDFDSVSANSAFFLPEAGIARRINEEFSWGLSLYGNGGLNTSYEDTNGVAGSNFNPGRCGNQESNFLFGCGNVGIDISQVIIAPTLSWQFSPRHSFGVAPLLGYQQFKAYGLQAFEGVSQDANAVSNRGYDRAFGAGVRVGWYAQMNPWLSLGASYSSRVFFERLEKYRGLLAGDGRFDIPANFSVGLSVKPLEKWEVAVDVQHIEFGKIRALGNGGLNSLQDPANSPLGGRNGSGFNWRDQTNYRIALIHQATPQITLRAGFAYGRQPQRDRTANSVTFNMLAPNPTRNATVGMTYKWNGGNDFHFAYGRYIEADYSGPSASAGLGVGGIETITPHVDSFWLGWSKRI